MFNLEGKVAIITGSAQGIGRSIALSFAQSGAKVVICDINGEKISSVVKEIADQGYQAIGVRTDISVEEDCNHLARECVNLFGGIDILVNSAAIMATIKMKPFWEIPVQEWDTLMAVNLKGTFLMCKACVPFMREKGFGRIINFSSATTFSGRPLYLHYVTSKAGIIGMTRAIAREAGDFGITANVIAPGSTRTEVERETTNKERENIMIQGRCIKRPQVPEDIVGAVSFLASDEAGFITAQTLVIDGGLICN